MYSITVLWPLAVFLVWFGCTGLALSTYLIGMVAPAFLDEHPVGRLLSASTHAFIVVSLTFLLFLGTCTLYALLVVEWANRELLVRGHAVRVTVRHVPALPIPAALPTLHLGKGHQTDYREIPNPDNGADHGGPIPDEDGPPSEVSVDTSAPDGTQGAVLVGEMTAILEDHPDWIDYLERMIALDEAHPPVNEYDGWEWQDVRTPPAILSQMLVRGLLNRVYSSRNSTLYRLIAPAEIRAALELLRDGSEPEQESAPLNVHQLFTLVFGHDCAKAVLRAALQADSPVHVLLHGPPGSAKNLLLSDVARLLDAVSYAGSTTTESGLVGLLLQKRPRYVVLDELDKLADADLTPLLNLMEGGYVVLLQHERQVRVQLDTRVFATANDVDKIPAPIQSRFAKVEIPGYSPGEFMKVAQAVLIQREKIEPEVARLVANEVVRVSTDIRDAVHVARLSKGQPATVPIIVSTLFPKGGRLTALPRED